MIEYTNKITALYSRLSVGDEDRDGGESNRIVNQRAFLERYARQHKLMNIRCLYSSCHRNNHGKVACR